MTPRSLPLLAALLALVPLNRAHALQEGFSAVGPVNPDNGFPGFYQDIPGLKLDLCLNNSGFCLLPGPVTLVDSSKEFPDNYGGTFPDESFYWACDASMPTNNGGQADLILGLEAAFANGPVEPGQQITFGRIRIRVDNLDAGQSYAVTTPVGVFTFVAANSAARGINFTSDIGGLPGDFATSLDSGLGPFLIWDADLPVVDAAGNQYIGDPNVLHT